MSRATCPKCKTRILDDDGACECGYGVKRRQEQQHQRAEDSGILCAWDDHGHRCPCRWVINGYCREHWDRVNGRVPEVIGNGLPPHAKRPNESVIDYMERRAILDRPARRDRTNDDTIVASPTNQGEHYGRP